MLRLRWLLLLMVSVGVMSSACQTARSTETLSPTAMSPRQPLSATETLPVRTTIPIPMPTAMPLAGTPTRPSIARPITLTIVYDNRSADARLKTAWGFACLIETGAATILFDTGGDGHLLVDNLTALGVDPRAIDAVVLSHGHSDHTGGLDQLLAVNDRLTVYLPRSFPAAFKASIHNPVVEITEARLIADGVRTTGELGRAIVEQSLIIETHKGSIVLTGCAHPGIVETVQQAKAYGEVYLVVGGLHLADYRVAEVQGVIAELKRLGVQQVAPSHCTGERAIEQFSHEFGTGFIPVGAGAIVHVEQ